MQACPNDQCPHRTLTGRRAAFEGDRTHCSDCDAALVAVDGEDAPDEAPAAQPAAPSGPRWPSPAPRARRSGWSWSRGR